LGDKTYRTIRWVRPTIWVAGGAGDYRSENTMPDWPRKNDMGKNKWICSKKTVIESDATFKE